MPSSDLARVIPINSRRDDTVDDVIERMLGAVPLRPDRDRDRLRECIEATQTVA
jgi:hypothetical protein